MSTIHIQPQNRGPKMHWWAKLHWCAAVVIATIGGCGLAHGDTSTVNIAGSADQKFHVQVGFESGHANNIPNTDGVLYQASLIGLVVIQDGASGNRTNISNVTMTGKWHYPPGSVINRGCRVVRQTGNKWLVYFDFNMRNGDTLGGSCDFDVTLTNTPDDFVPRYRLGAFDIRVGPQGTGASSKGLKIVKIWSGAGNQMLSLGYAPPGNYKGPDVRGQTTAITPITGGITKTTTVPAASFSVEYKPAITLSPTTPVVEDVIVVNGTGRATASWTSNRGADTEVVVRGKAGNTWEVDTARNINAGARFSFGMSDKAQQTWGQRNESVTLTWAIK